MYGLLNKLLYGWIVVLIDGLHEWMDDEQMNIDT